MASRTFLELPKLVSLPAHVSLQAITFSAKPGKGETLPQAIERVRDHIASAQQHRAMIRSTPLPKADLKVRATAMVQDLARRGRPRINVERGQLQLGWSDGSSYSAGASASNVAALLAWFDLAAMTKCVHAEIDALPEPKLALSADEKSARVRQLTADIERLERTEEALIEMHWIRTWWYRAAPMPIPPQY